VLSHHRDRTFKKLQAEWYKKLKDEGFKDIEDTNSENEFLKDWHSSYFQTRHTPLDFEANAEYYRRATALLNGYEFASELERSVWALHSDGVSLRKIAAKLEIKVWLAHNIVVFHEAQMKACLPLMV
jgi:uncharacterized protein YdaT